jgi:phenylalanyl-tRNA synthetase beta chain
MKVPLSWLREYVEFDLSPRELAAKLTFSGTEVEGIETLGGEYAGVVAGEVLSVDKHPNADRLTVCRVNAGGGGEVLVVCGAPNVRVGMKVPLAMIGATLPNGMAIKKTKVRGVESFGMLCAEDELKVSDDHSGVMALPDDTFPGTPLSEILGAPETVLELEVTPNRPDCLSMIGIAREIAALLGKPLRLPDVTLAETTVPVESLTRVDVEDAVACPRYTARVISDIRIGPSPKWMQRRLSCAGIRPINNIVDITNYVMLECGQPLHAFDYHRLGEHRIVVRHPQPAEPLNTLDGQRRAIEPEMLIIADAERPVAVAGVMGGAGSEIQDTTATVLLESACFKAQDIRRTSKRLGLSSESSYRFERGVDVGNVEWASRRAAALMAAHGGGTVARGVIDVAPGRPAERRVRLRYGYARRLLGIELDDAGMNKILTSLGFSVTAAGPDACDVTTPTYRVDVDQEVDLIEEIARIHGLDKVPSPSPAARIVRDADDRPTRALVQCRHALTGLGLTEIMNYSFLADRLLSFVNYGSPEKRIVLPNPVSADYAVLRDSLIPQMVETLGRNRSRQAREAALFELGRVFRAEAELTYSEEDRVCIGLMGPVGRAGQAKAQAVEPDEMFQWLRGVLEGLCGALKVPSQRQGGLSRPGIVFGDVSCGCFEPGRAVSVTLDGEPAGVLGLIDERVRSEWRIVDPVGVLELRLAPLLKHVLDVPAFKPVATYPGVDRDVAMVVDDGVTHEAVVSSMWQAAPPELVDIRLFDVYRGQGLGEGRKSLAYSLTYRSMEKTLTDEAVNAMHDRVKATLRSALKAEIRES